MGSCSSICSSKKLDKKQQTNLGDSPIFPSNRNPRPPSISEDDDRPHRSIHVNNVNGLVWPLPPEGDWSVFNLSVDDGYGGYLLSPRSLSPTPRLPVKEATNQRTTLNEEWSKEFDDQKMGSAHVQSELEGRFHACFNLTTCDNIDGTMERLKKIQTDVDIRLNRRLMKISEQTEKNISKIIAHTKKEQELLLSYDKEVQRHQEELYQRWLQMYISILNQWRSRDLANFQEILSEHQRNILQRSKRKIDQLNEEANEIKKKILIEEQDKLLLKSHHMTESIYRIETDEPKYLGSEFKSEMKLKLFSNVGRIYPGNNCQNNP